MKMIIGTTELTVTDNSMGGLSGIFIPNENYTSIKNKIQKFNSSDNKDFDLWDSLRLNAQLENGYFIHPIGGISIWDFSELKDEKIEVDFAGVFRHLIDDYFKTDPPRTLGINND